MLGDFYILEQGQTRKLSAPAIIVVFIILWLSQSCTGLYLQL